MSKDESKKLLKQRLQRVHVVVGISFSYLMYIAVFFGIFAILLPYITLWEKPSRHIQSVEPTNVNYSAIIEPVLADPEYPKINGVNIILPNYLEDPTVKISAMFTKTKLFDPNIGKEIENEDKQSQLAYFLNIMHYGWEFKRFGYTIFGFMAVAVMFLVIGGVIQTFLIKYKNTGKNAQSRFSKWHRKIFIWVFPPFIIITLTGALMNIGYSGSSPMTYLASKGQTTEVFALAGPVLFPTPPIEEKKNIPTPMIEINELIKKAKEINPNIDYQKIRLTNWGDLSARAKLEGYNPYMPFLNGISNKPSVTLSGVDGTLIAQQNVMDKHWSGLVYDSIFFLHFLFGVDTFTRLFIATIMSVSIFAIGFGVLLFLEKKSRKFPDNIPVYNGLGKFSLAVMIGVIPATGLLFALQWILPMNLQDRFLWQKGSFFILWLATLTWSFYRINSYQAAKELLKLGGILFFISPFIHFYNSGFSPIKLYNLGMIEILSVDIGLLIFGTLLLYVSKKLPIKRQEIEKLWIKKL